jgi:hypothetical protein
MTMKRFRLRKMDGPDFPVSFPRIPVKRKINNLIYRKLKYFFLIKYFDYYEDRKLESTFSYNYIFSNHEQDLVSFSFLARNGTSREKRDVENSREK